MSKLENNDKVIVTEDNKVNQPKPYFKHNDIIPRTHSTGYEFDNTMYNNSIDTNKNNPSPSNDQNLTNSTNPIPQTEGNQQPEVAKPAIKLNLGARSFMPKNNAVTIPATTTNSTSKYTMNYETNKVINNEKGITSTTFPIQNSNQFILNKVPFGGNSTSFYPGNTTYNPQQSYSSSSTTLPTPQIFNPVDTSQSNITLNVKASLNTNSIPYTPKNLIPNKQAYSYTTISGAGTPISNVKQEDLNSNSKQFNFEHNKSDKQEVISAPQQPLGEVKEEVKKKSKLHDMFEQNKVVELTVDVKNEPQVIKQANHPANNQRKQFFEAKKQVDTLKQDEEKKKKEKADLERIQKEEKQREKQKQEEEKSVVERNYFLVKQNKPKTLFTMDLNYMKKFQNINICKQKDLLSDQCKTHLEGFLIKEEEKTKTNKQNYHNNNNLGRSKNPHKPEPKKEEPPSSFKRSTKTDAPVTQETTAPASTLKQWGRRDLSKFINEAEEQRDLMNKARTEDPIKDEIVFWLNKITVDIYDEVRDGIFNIIKDNIDYQIKLVEVLFKKALTEKYFVNLYAKLCKDFDEILPQKVENSEAKKSASVFRKNLLDKSKQIFSFESIEKDKEEDKDVKIDNYKKYILGNVIFITELIQTKVMTKNVADQCLAALFKKLTAEEEKKEVDLEFRKIKQHLIIEGIVIILDRFGTFVNKFEKGLKAETLKEINTKIDGNINKINDYVEENSKVLPGHIQYKVINLIEKKKRGWELSEIDKIQKAKGVKEIEEQRVKDQEVYESISQDEINRLVKEEIVLYKESKKGNGYFNWEISTGFFGKGAKLYQVLTAINEVSVDYVNNVDVAVLVYSYFYEVYKFYLKSEGNDSIQKLRETLLDIIQNLNDAMLDNKLLSIVIGQIFLILCYDRIACMKPNEVDMLELDEDQASALFEAIRCIYYSNKNDNMDKLYLFKDQFNACKTVDKYRSRFDEIVKK